MSNTKKTCELARLFTEFVEERTFPCVGAKAASGRDQIDFVVARDIASSWNDIEIAEKLGEFARAYKASPLLFRSLAVLFECPNILTERAFERHMWVRLQSFSDKDSLFGAPADGRVATDPTSPHFGLSFGGEAFFVVGMHPGASRPARRFSHAALVFNVHDQFTQLRAQGKYEAMRRRIIARDVKLSGSANPMLSRHGDSSEARQYSGRVVGEQWTCPFERRDYGWSAALENL